MQSKIFLILFSIFFNLIVKINSHPLDYLFYENLNCQRRSIGEELEILPKQPNDFPFDNEIENKLYSAMYNLTTELNLWNNFYHHHYISLTILGATPNFLFDAGQEALELIKDHPSMKDISNNMTKDDLHFKLYFGAYVLHYISNCGWDVFYQTFDQRMIIDTSSCELPKECFIEYPFQDQDVSYESELFCHLISPVSKFYRDMLSIMREIILKDAYESKNQNCDLDAKNFYKSISRIKNFLFYAMLSSDMLNDGSNPALHYITLIELENIINYWQNLKIEKKYPKGENFEKEFKKLISTFKIAVALAEQDDNVNVIKMMTEYMKSLNQAKSFIEYNEAKVESIMEHPLMDHSIIKNYSKNLIMRVYRMAEYMINNGCEKFIEKYC